MKEDILEGLKSAVSKGESLKQAMQSFYNAGYKKEEIEEAARDLQKNQVENKKQPIKQEKSYKEKIEISKGEKPVQRVSNYEQTSEKPKRNILIFVLTIILLVLLGIIIGLFLFREELTGLLNRFF
jgi:ATP-dependent Zn protease|tara:strand:- start:4259 stop:4636 length:378 start_codon:yes stop_codon:yes gene_type:complete